MAQLSALGAAVALGAAGGLVYDLLRVLRRRRPGLTHAADGLFALLCLLGTLWVLTQVGGGEPQLYMLAPGRAWPCICCWPHRRCGLCGSSGPMWPGSWGGCCASRPGLWDGAEKNCCQKQKKASILRESTLY